MDLKNRINEDIKKALRTRETFVVEALRFLSSSMKNKEISSRPHPITEEDRLAVIRRLVQQARETMQQSKKAKREDVFKKSEKELKLFESYLPLPMNQEELASIIERCLEDLEVKSIKGMGQVIQEVMSRTKGRADKRVVSQVIREKLKPS